MSFSGTGRDGFILQHGDEERYEQPEQPRRPRSVADQPVQERRGDRVGRSHASAARWIRAGDRGRRPDAAAGQPAYAQIAADLHYTPPSFNAFDRLTDTDTRWQSNQDLGGASADD